MMSIPTSTNVKNGLFASALTAALSRHGIAAPMPTLPLSAGSTLPQLVFPYPLNLRAPEISHWTNTYDEYFDHASSPFSEVTLAPARLTASDGLEFKSWALGRAGQSRELTASELRPEWSDARDINALLVAPAAYARFLRNSHRNSLAGFSGPLPPARSDFRLEIIESELTTETRPEEIYETTLATFPTTERHGTQIHISGTRGGRRAHPELLWVHDIIDETGAMRIVAGRTGDKLHISLGSEPERTNRLQDCLSIRLHCQFGHQLTAGTGTIVADSLFARPHFSAHYEAGHDVLRVHVAGIAGSEHFMHRGIADDIAAGIAARVRPGQDGSSGPRLFAA